jgi:hypothetical protein
VQPLTKHAVDVRERQLAFRRGGGIEYRHSGYVTVRTAVLRGEELDV